MKKSILLVLATAMIFLGCATKINMAEFRNKAVLKDENAPKSFKNVEHKGAVVKFSPKFFNGTDLSKIAQYSLVSNLKRSGLLKELKIINKNQINEYIKLVEIEKSTEGNVLFHLIKGNLLSISITDNGTYHKPIYDKKGRVIRKACYSYEVCAQMNGMVLSLPSQNIEFEETKKDCEDSCEYSNNYYIVNQLANSAVRNVAIDISNDMKNIFTPIGYVYEYKENKDHEIIAHITLGSQNGIKQNMKVYFYKVQKDSLGKKTLIKIGEGTVSQIIEPDNSWVVVEFYKGYQPKIGYVVKPDVSVDFFSKIRSMF